MKISHFVLLVSVFFVVGCGSEAEVDTSTLSGATYFWKQYSRGNDDLNETDKAGVSNYETAQILAALVTAPKGSGLGIYFKYQAYASTPDTATAFKNNEIKVRPTTSNLDSKGNAAPKLKSLPQCKNKALDPNLYGTAVEVGTANGNKEYKGDIEVKVIGGGGQGDLVKEIIHWSVRVENGAPTEVTLKLEEQRLPGKRDPQEVLVLTYQSDNLKSDEPVRSAFPLKQ